MGTTPNRAYPYPDPDDEPDGPGAFYDLAMAVEADTSFSFQGWVPSANQAYGPGSNALIRIGKLRVLHFSIVNNFDVEVGSGFYQLPAGDEPGGTIPGAGRVKVGAAWQVASFVVQPDRSVVLAAGTGGSGYTHEGTLVWTV